VADDIEGLLSPSAISPVSHNLPRQDEQLPRRRRQPHAPPAPEEEEEAEAGTTAAEETAPTLVGTHLNVRV
jgi:hypothetical protein